MGWVPRLKRLFFRRDALEDLQPLMKEALEMKQDNDRRKRRRETLRISLLRILELMAQHRVFAHR